MALVPNLFFFSPKVCPQAGFWPLNLVDRWRRIVMSDAFLSNPPPSCEEHLESVAIYAEVHGSLPATSWTMSFIHITHAPDGQHPTQIPTTCNVFSISLPSKVKWQCAFQLDAMCHAVGASSVPPSESAGSLRGMMISLSLSLSLGHNAMVGNSHNAVSASP
eukprot:GGOE01020348.1.p1 GENE.GGOE01020348.1~~GGOE01020348.1.p1  ORF type:complete len:162 (-),score=7.18 GGOE01020348.1:198-683(-)